MVNSPAVLRWNLDKRYLAALSEAGVATVPTTWLTPGQDPVEHELATSRPGEFVVKPTISGGGFETAALPRRRRAGGARRPGPRAAPPRAPGARS